MTDRLEQEYADLANETGVPTEEIPIALTAFDKVFPTENGWFRQPAGDSRKLLMLMPAPMRGVGSVRRLFLAGIESYKGLVYEDQTASRLSSDHNSLVRLLECSDEQLVA